jgi:hypothetical protein
LIIFAFSTASNGFIKQWITEHRWRLIGSGKQDKTRTTISPTQISPESLKKSQASELKEAKEYKMKTISFVCVAICCFSSCKNPVDNKTGTEENLIQNPSFESNGNPTTEGWTYYSNFPAADTSDGTFSNDVPPGGGNWSLVVGVGDRVVKYLETKVAAPTGEHHYRLSAWAKSYSTDTGSPGFISLALNDSVVKRLDVQDTTWRHYESIDTILTRAGDSLAVLLFSGAAMRFQVTYFDLCRLELLK